MQLVSLILIHWIEIYLVDNAIRRLNNPGLELPLLTIGYTRVHAGTRVFLSRKWGLSERRKHRRLEWLALSFILPRPTHFLSHVILYNRSLECASKQSLTKNKTHPIYQSTSLLHSHYLVLPKLSNARTESFSF